MINYWDACADSRPQKVSLNERDDNMNVWWIEKLKFKYQNKWKLWVCKFIFYFILFYWSLTSERKDRIERYEMKIFSMFCESNFMQSPLWVEVYIIFLKKMLVWIRDRLEFFYERNSSFEIGLLNNWKYCWCCTQFKEGFFDKSKLKFFQCFLTC